MKGVFGEGKENILDEGKSPLSENRLSSSLLPALPPDQGALISAPCSLGLPQLCRGLGQFHSSFLEALLSWLCRVCGVTYGPLLPGMLPSELWRGRGAIPHQQGARAKCPAALIFYD